MNTGYKQLLVKRVVVNKAITQAWARVRVQARVQHGSK